MTFDDIKSLCIDDSSINIETIDGRFAKEDLKNYRRLREATPKQLKNFITNQFGIHWPDIDEDLSFAGFFQKKESLIGQLVKKHPVLNMAALARRIGIPQPLFAAYVSGSKKPSLKRLERIKEEIRAIGRELANIEK